MNKQESRFPWSFGVDGNLLYFGKINRHVFYYSSKDVDVSQISQDIKNSPMVGVAIDIIQNGIIRVLTFCTKTSVFVISISSDCIVNSLTGLLSLIISKVLVGYNIKKSVEILKKTLGISLNVKDFLENSEYKASFKSFIEKNNINSILTRSENDIQAVAKFEYLLGLSDQVMYAISQPAVLSYYFITEIEGSSTTDIEIPHTFYQQHKKGMFSLPFGLLPGQKSDPSKLKLVMKSKDISIDDINAKIEEDKKKQMSSPVKRFEQKKISLNVGINTRQVSGRLETKREGIKPLVIKRARTETPPPQREKEQRVLHIETRKRKDSLPMNYIPPIIVKKQGKKYTFDDNLLCPVCKAEMDTTIDVASHIILKHGCEKTLVCAFQRVNCPNYVCNECNQYFMSKETFIFHVIDKHTKNLYDALVASKILESREEILGFISKMANEISCGVLIDNWTPFKELESNMRDKNAIVTQQKCNICNKKFDTVYDLLYHCYNAHNKFK